MAVTVIPMGWLLAVEICQDLHRNIVKRCGDLPARLEIRRDRPFPLGASRRFFEAWKVYIDDFKHAQVFSKGEVDILMEKVPRLLSLAGTAYDESGAEGNPKKTEVNKVEVASLGEQMNGIRGDRTCPLAYDLEVVDLTMFGLSKRRPSKKLLEILGGRWLRLQSVRKPTAAAFNRFWRWMTLPRPGRPSRNVVAELLLSCLLLPLYRHSFRATIDPLVTASDAAERGGCLMCSSALSAEGLAAAKAIEEIIPEETARQVLEASDDLCLLALFDGIGGQRGAFDSIGVSHALYVAAECLAPAI